MPILQPWDVFDRTFGEVGERARSELAASMEGWTLTRPASSSGARVAARSNSDKTHPTSPPEPDHR